MNTITLQKTTSDTSRKITINNDLDIIVARLQAREIARDLGFGTIDQARISLAAGELARVLAEKLTCTGEIIISGVHTDSHLGIQVTSINPDAPTNTKTNDDTHNKIEKTSNNNNSNDKTSDNTNHPNDNPPPTPDALAPIRHLVDDSTIETDHAHNTRITLMKWLA